MRVSAMGAATVDEVAQRRQRVDSPARGRFQVPLVWDTISFQRTPMTTTTITPEMTMEQVLAIAPAAQRALFQRYHVGGCSSCGFQPTDTLAQLCKDHNMLDVKEVIQTIQTAQDADSRLNVDAKTVKQWLDKGEDFSFIDVRTPQELALARIRQ